MAARSFAQEALSAVGFRMMILFFWLFAVLVLSVVPVSSPEMGGTPADKVAHFLLYGVTALLVARAIRKRMPKGWSVIAAVVIASAYGAAMEVVQHLLPYRSFSFADMAANFAGAVVFSLGAWAGRRR